MEAEGQKAAGAHAETSNSNGKGYLTIKELLEQVERVSGQRDVNQLNFSDLVNLEEQLQDALAQTRSKKVSILYCQWIDNGSGVMQNRDLMQSIAGLAVMEKALTEENKHLKKKVAEAGSSQNLKKGITLNLFGNRAA